ncbi:MAG: ADOP family duplicated permease [Vicinamibacterales bacterium]
MRTLRALWRRAGGVFAGRRAEQDLHDEMESHIQHHVDDNLRAGMSPAEARRQALLATGGMAAAAEAVRDRRGLPSLESLVRDVRYGARTLWRSPGFALAGIVILGLGVGINSAIFTVVNAVVLRPLPFKDADRIVRIWHTPPQATFPGMTEFALSPANFLDWQAASTSFEAMTLYGSGQPALTGHGEATAVNSRRVQATFLPIFGLQPILGRTFTQGDEAEGASPVAVLAEPFWRSRFGADRGIVGRTIQLDGRPVEVVGVVPTASFLASADLFTALQLDARTRAVRDNHNLLAVAKLKPGVSVPQAQAELSAIAARLELQYPAENNGWGALVLPLHEDLVGDARPALLTLLGAVGLVLLIACANLANLMLVRTHSRAKEIALRSALGGSRTRVVQQLLAEGLVLGTAGGVVGLLAAFYAVQAMLAALGPSLPRWQDVRVDGQAVAFTAAVAMLTGLVAAFVPAWRLSGRDANDVLKRHASRGSSGHHDGWMRQGLVVSEVALALMLLVGAGLLIRSLGSLRAVDPGFDPKGVLTASLSLPSAKYGSLADKNQFFDRVRQRVGVLPGVESVAIVDSPPFTGGSTQFVYPEEWPATQDSELPTVAARSVSPGYFRAARIPLIAGRDFTEADGAEASKVIVVSARTAERFWPGENPLGKHVTLKMLSPEPREVVGVVGEVKLDGLDARESDSETVIYSAHKQLDVPFGTLFVRTAGAPDRLTPSIVAAVHEIDPAQPVLDTRTMTDILEESLGQRPFAMQLLAGFAALALVLASVGIYSVLAYTVRQRMREIGIRLALGASRTSVLRMVMLEGLAPTLMGVIAGLVLAVVGSRLMASLLFGVGAHDPATFALVSILVVIVGLAATWIPAWRATQVDPIETLRAE